MILLWICVFEMIVIPQSRQIDRLSHTTTACHLIRVKIALYGASAIANLISMKTHSKKAYFYVKIRSRCFYSLNNVNAVSLSIFLSPPYNLFIFISFVSLVDCEQNDGLLIVRYQPYLENCY